MFFCSYSTWPASTLKRFISGQCSQDTIQTVGAAALGVTGHHAPFSSSDMNFSSSVPSRSSSLAAIFCSVLYSAFFPSVTSLAFLALDHHHVLAERPPSFPSWDFLSLLSNHSTVCFSLLLIVKTVTLLLSKWFFYCYLYLLSTTVPTGEANSIFGSLSSPNIMPVILWVIKVYLPRKIIE